MAYWLTADHHFGHKRIIQYSSRCFSDVDEMDRIMIERWNERVNDDDIVWHLGDVAVCKIERLEEIMRQLKGRKRLILGNHDQGRTITRWKKLGFEEVYRHPVITDGGLVVLSHYPLATPLESINIHGHLHEMSAPSEMHLCVSVEQSDYYPVLWKTETPLEAEDETDRFPVYTFVP